MSAQQQAVARSLDTIANDLGITDSSAASRVYRGVVSEPGRHEGDPSGRRRYPSATRAISRSRDAVRKVQQISRDAGLTDERAVVHAAMAGGGFENGGQAGRRGSSRAQSIPRHGDGVRAPGIVVLL